MHIFLRALSPNLVVSWMVPANPMTIQETGVAYDPSCVQHAVRINEAEFGLRTWYLAFWRSKAGRLSGLRC